MGRRSHCFVTLTVALSALAAWASPASACTGIGILPKDGSIITARTLEFGVDFHSKIVVIPRQRAFAGTAPGDMAGLRWQSILPARRTWWRWCPAGSW